MIDLLLAVHLFFTLFMTGLIWFVQVVHYPLMGKVGEEYFVAYEQTHTRLTGYVVAPAMLTELATAVLLWWVSRPGLSLSLNLGLLLLIWASTFFIQVPLHNKLSTRFHPEWHRTLVRGNWLRTVLWTVRGGLLIWWFVMS